MRQTCKGQKNQIIVLGEEVEAMRPFKGEYESQQNKIEALKKNHARDMGEIEKLTTKREDLLSRNVALQDEIKSFERQQTRLEEDVDALEARLRRRDDKIDTLTQELDDSDATIDRLRRERNKLRDEVEYLTDRLHRQ